MRKNRVVIGMDCGESATRTQAASLDRLILADHSHKSLWNGNFYPDEEQIAGEINNIILSICKENGIGFDEIAAIAFILPGNQRNDEKYKFLQRLRELWKRRKYTPKFLETISAPMLALTTFYPVKPAIVVTCDANAYVLARDVKDEFIYAGGWGGAVPDPGSTRALAYSVLQYIAQVYDRRSINSPFFKGITRELSIDTRASFHRALYDPGFDSHKLLDFTLRAADERNIVATSILDSAAHGLVDLIRHVATRLPVSKRIPLMLTGRMLEEEKLFRSIVQRKINATLPHIAISPQPFNAAESAVQYAVDIVRESKRARKNV